MERYKQRGFTLIEIIVALLVITVALGAVISTTGTSVEHGAYLKEKTIALWVAENNIAEMTITRQWPDGQQSQEVTMAGREWTVVNDITQTPDENIRRVDLSVYADKKQENKLVTLIAYIIKPQTFKKNK